MAGTSVTTILACDIVESTALMTRIGDDAADALRRTLFARWRAAIEAEGGTVVKTIGDAIMAVFTASAVGAVVAAEQLHTAAADVDGVRVRVRVGIATGEAAEDDGDWFGAPVVEAFRLCARAEPDEILLGAVTRRVVGSRGGFEFSELGPMALKGLPEPVVVYALAHEGAPAPRRADDRPPRWRRPALVGGAVVLVAIGVVIAFLATGDSSEGAAAAPDRAELLARLDYRPRLAPRTCTEDEGLGDGAVTCWTLTVPEDRRAPDGRSVRLPVVKAPAADAKALPQIALVGSTGPAAVSDQRAVADQYTLGVRGEGESRPTLRCDEEIAARRARLAMPSAAARQARVEDLERCRQRLTDDGIEIEHYGPADVADDVRDLALAARLDRVDLRMYGDRGPTVAAMLTRRTPGLARAAILTSPVPPLTSRFDRAAAADGALRTLFDECAADRVCSAVAPGLAASTTSLFGELAAAPPTVSTADPDGVPVPVHVDADRAAQALWLAFHDQTVYGIVPATITNRAYDQVAAYLVLEQLGPQLIEPGLASVVWSCRHASDESLTSLRAARVAYPRWAALVDVETLELCARWDIDPSPEVRLAPISNLPALLVYGALEPDARDIARMVETFRGSQLLPLRSRVSGDRNFWPRCVAPLRSRFSVQPTAKLPGESCGRTASPVDFSAS